ncbi:hypothetical protein V1506DRAFT_542017 [Lipomyces tetrasporus]
MPKYPSLAILAPAIIVMASLVLAPFAPLALRIKVLGISRLIRIDSEHTRRRPESYSGDLVY